MIRLHRLGGSEHEFDLNPDLVLSVESTPDTVVTLTTGAKIIVTESPDSVTAAVREWRIGILERALKRTGPQFSEARLRAVDNPAEN
ncbi:MAG TPA: flagellar FlbD family protein [Solirubrobacterales bacterium]|jgi:flagellar protein FlbD|nr:flagellar FlbD family protein [Solirubrobacterales bacterium]